MEKLLKDIKEGLNELNVKKEDLANIKEEKDNKSVEIKTIQDEIKFIQIGDMRKELKENEIDKKNAELEKLEKTYNDKKDGAKKEFETEKTKMKEEVLKKLSVFKFKADVEEMKNEVVEMEKRRDAYKKVAENASQTIDAIQEKLAKGDMTGIDKITSANSEKKQYEKYVNDIQQEINNKNEEISQYIIVEENQDEYSDLKYLESQVNGFQFDRINDFEKFVDGIYGKYVKEEKAENKEVEEMSEDKNKMDNKKHDDIDISFENTDNVIKDRSEMPEIEFKNERSIAKEKPDIKFGDNKNELEKNDIDLKFPNGISKNVQKQADKEYLDLYSDREQKIKVTVENGKIVYNFIDKANGKEWKEEWLLREYKNYLKKVKKMPTINGKNNNAIEPYLLSSVGKRWNFKVFEDMLAQMNRKEGLDEVFQSIIEYDMAGAKELGFRDRWQLRKIAKTAQNLNLNVENAEEIKFSFKNDILRGLGDLFKGTIKGLAAGKTETQALLEESREKELSDKEMEELKQREAIETEKTKHETYVEELSKAANKKESSEPVNINYNAKFIDRNDEIVSTNNEAQNDDKEIE